MKRRDFLASGAAALATVPWFPPARAAQGEFRTLTAMQGRAALRGKGHPATAIWGYDGAAPGPVLRLSQGKEFRLRLVNRLAQPTSTHWHGIRVPNAMDGVSGLTQEPAPPGGGFDYVFSPPDAGTYWYHTHNRSWEQMARGLHGMLVVAEKNPPRVDHDIPLVVDDWRLDKQGQIHEKSFGAIRDWAHGGRIGNWITVNGGLDPEFKVKAGDRVRLRILNAANARIAQLAFPDHKPTIIAFDGQPVAPRPLGDRPLVVAPGQRVDLMIDMSLAPGSEAPVAFTMRDRSIAIASFRYDPGAPRRDNPLDAPIRLPDNPLPGPLELATAKEVALHMEGGAMGRMRGATLKGRALTMRELVKAGKVWAFNGVAGMPDVPLLRIQRGRTAVIDMNNDNAWPHAMHLHGHHFRVVRRAGKPVTAGPWRDTELIMPRERVAIAFVADAPGKWLLHCHMLEHQAGGMITWIEVV
ncbi:MAG: multicopper oxidase family protein [Alphaproteobacteria bacterium]